MRYVGGSGEVHTEFQWGNPRERDNLEDLRINGKIILEWISKTSVERAWTRSMWLRTGRGGGLL